MAIWTTIRVTRAALIGVACLALLAVVHAENTAIIPVAGEGDNWTKRNDAMNARVKEGHVDIIYIGDSIVQHWDAQGKDTWDRYYAPRNAVNLGISGDRTEHVLWRLEHGNIDGITPKLAIVMIGQNNGPHNTGEEIAEGVTAIVNMLRSKLPDTKILLLAIFPRREKPTEERVTLATANGILAKLADDETIFYMDVNNTFVRPDGSIPASLMPDFEHPNAEGHRLWAEAIETKVAELMGDTPVEPVRYGSSPAPGNRE